MPEKVARRALWAVVLAAAACGPGPRIAHAQDDITKISIEDLANAKVYSATRFLQKTIDAPASITIVTAEQIRRFGYRTLGDVLGNLSDFYVSDDRNYLYLGVRGFSRPGDYLTRVLVLVDGHRINDPVYDQGEIDRRLPVDVDLIERVEIVRGPTSSLYGTNAMLAVINVITKRGAALNGVQVSGEVGGLGAYGSRLSFGRRFAGGKDLLLSISGINLNGDQQVYFPEFNDPATNSGVAVGLDGERARTLYGSFAAKGISIRGAYGRRFKLVPTGSYGSIFNQRENTLDTTAYFDASLDHSFPRWDFHGHLAYDAYSYDGVYQFDPRDPYLDHARARWWTWEAMGSVPLRHRQKLQVGGELRYATERRQYTNLNEIGASLLPSAFVGSVFVQDEFAIHSKLTAVAGVRYDEFGNVHSVNPRFAVVFKPRGSTAIKFLASTAFRAPNAYEQTYYTAQTWLPTLNPEKIHAFELIVEHYLGPDARLSLSAYRNSMHGLITQKFATAYNELGFINAGDVDSNGITVEAEKRFSRGLYLRGSWSVQRTIDPATRLIISNSPVHLGKAAIIVPLFGKRLDLGLTERALSGVENVRGAHVPAYSVTDLTVSSIRLWRKGEISASVYNVFNNRIRVPGAEEHAQESIPQYGRTWRVKLTHSFLK